MRKHIILLVALTGFGLLLVSCSFTDMSYDVSLSFGERSPWEHVTQRRAWYTLVYLSSDNTVITQFVPASATQIRLEIPKGLPLIAAAYPYGIHAPVGACLDSGDSHYSQVRLTSSQGEVADKLLAYRREFRNLIPTLDMSRLCSSIWDDTEGKPYRADWGQLYSALQFSSLEDIRISSRETHRVETEDVQPGYWVCDHRFVPIVTVSELSKSFHTDLPEGTYRFFNKECPSYVIRIDVSAFGQIELSRKRGPRELYF